MKLFAISDLHLSLNGGALLKPMDRFGCEWVDHHRKVADDWKSRVGPSDVVIVAGDLSWASGIEDAWEDLQWLGALPGRKVLVKGNHDWWVPKSGVRSKLASILPPSVSMVHGDAVLVEGLIFFGTRLWVIPDLDFPVDWSAGESVSDYDRGGPILSREMERLRRSVESAAQMPVEQVVTRRICVTHFPPTDFRATRTKATDILSAFGTHSCVFGHVHGLRRADNGVKVDGVSYYLTSCDYVGFRLLEIPL
jgi:predicted phosphohydrolase